MKLIASFLSIGMGGSGRSGTTERAHAAARLAVIALVNLAALASSGSAAAQAPAKAPPRTGAVTHSELTLKTADYTEQNISGDQVVKFTGDELAGAVNGAYGTTIRRPPGILRTLLIRPRVNFVPELVASVENL